MKNPFTLPSIPKIKSPIRDTEVQVSLAIIVCFALGVLGYLSLFGFAGTFGALVGGLITLGVGRGSIIVPLFFFAAGGLMLRIQKNEKLSQDINGRFGWGLSFFLLAILGILSLTFGIENPNNVENGGGVIGYYIYPIFLGYFDRIGGGFILFCIALFGFFLFSQLTFAQFYDRVESSFRDPSKIWDLVPDVFEIWKSAASAKPSHDQSENLTAVTSKQNSNGEKNQNIVNIKVKDDPDNDMIETPTTIYKPIIVDDQAFDRAVENSLDSNSREVTLDDLPLEANRIYTQTRMPTAAAAKLNWVLPSFDILKLNDKTNIAQVDIEESKETIRQTLQSFGIAVEMGEAVVGPTVTQFTFRPALGVKLAAINALQRDLALALAAPSIRMELPISGRSAVGIQIPNRIKSQVRLRDLLQTDQFANASELTPLPLAIGKDVFGHNLIYSLTKMPHLLVAGSTGAGKSVWINSMLLSLLFTYSPTDLQLILVDMKRVELKLYDKIPHLLANVITDAEKAINALKWTVLEMDRRYKLLEQYGKRNIRDYNNFAKEMNMENLPYLVFVIDELGDLMMLAKNEVEPIIVRLTQMSRAVGIHIVLGTQRPDVQVITGLIKANIPTRICFAVVTQIDSRVILGVVGGENLLGMGDGLIMSPNTMQPVRFQGANVEESEVRELVDYLREESRKNNNYTNYNASVTEPPTGQMNVPGMNTKRSKPGGKVVDGIAVYEEARRLVIKYQQCSADFLSEALSVDLKTASQIIDELEDNGVVGSEEAGSRGREVLIIEDEE